MYSLSLNGFFFFFFKIHINLLACFNHQMNFQGRSMRVLEGHNILGSSQPTNRNILLIFACISMIEVLRAVTILMVSLHAPCLCLTKVEGEWRRHKLSFINLSLRNNMLCFTASQEFLHKELIRKDNK